MCLRTKTTQVKRYSSIAPFVSQKHTCKGITSGFKKISTLRVVFFSRPCKHRRHTTHCVPVGTRCVRVGLFCFTRSLYPHSRLLLPPKPNKVFVKLI